MIEIVTRRSFLKIVMATMATPIIAKVALSPGLILPGIERVQEITKADLATDARFANAVFTPGNFPAACEIMEMNVLQRLPPKTFYEVRAVPLSRALMDRYVGYKRGGYAVLWVADGSMQRPEFLRQPPYGERVHTGRDEYLLIGRGITGGELLRAPGEPGFDPSVWDELLRESEARQREYRDEAARRPRIREIYTTPSGREVRVGLNGENLSGVIKRG